MRFIIRRMFRSFFSFAAFFPAFGHALLSQKQLIHGSVWCTEMRRSGKHLTFCLPARSNRFRSARKPITRASSVAKSPYRLPDRLMDLLGQTHKDSYVKNSYAALECAIYEKVWRCPSASSIRLRHCRYTSLSPGSSVFHSRPAIQFYSLVVTRV